MAATTLNRTSLTPTNDTGSAASPNGDGTVLNAAYFTLLMDRIDALLSGNITFGGRITSEGFGSHTISAGGTGANEWNVRNTTAGTGNLAQFNLGNDTTAYSVTLAALSSTYTTAGPAVAAGGLLQAYGAGGLSLSTNHASGDIRLYTNGGTLRTTLDQDGTLLHSYALRLDGMFAQTVTGNTELSGSVSTNVVCRVTSASSSPVITGALGYDGQVLFIKNVSGTAITLAHASGSSSPALRFICPGNSNIGIDDGDGVLCIYSGDDARWLVMGI